MTPQKNIFLFTYFTFLDEPLRVTVKSPCNADAPDTSSTDASAAATAPSTAASHEAHVMASTATTTWASAIIKYVAPSATRQNKNERQ